MAAKMLTKDPDGNIVSFSTKRGKPDSCSMTCPAVFRFKGELYCRHFNCVVGKRDPDCIKNEIKGVFV